jgi:serine/threonine protein kinase/ABC-type sugar transport system substrate-binding protein
MGALMADPFVGRKIGQYELRSLIGQGGMAVVYRANQSTLSREVAVKIVSRLLTQDPLFRQRFEREVNMIAHLEHANIVPVFEHGTTDDGAIYLAMRFIKGGTLAERLRQGPVSLPQAREWLRQISSALDYAHNLGVIHRDLKPGNILLDEQQIAYLVDFGLARMVELDDDHRIKTENLTKTGAFIGTPAYMSPEQINQDRLDRRSDLYSLGVVLYEMVVGSLPFQAEGAFKMMQAHLSDTPIPPRKLRPDLTPSVEAVLLKALDKNPDRRFQTAGAMAEAFAEAASSQAATVPITQSGLYSVPSRTGPFLVAALALLVIAMLAVGVVVILPMLNPSTPTTTPTQTATSTAISNKTPTEFVAAQRPKVGSVDDLKLSQAEIAHADQVFSGSFLGMVDCTLETDFHATLAAAVRQEAQKLGLTVQVLDANRDKPTESRLIDQLIAQGAKGMVVCPLDEAAIHDALQRAANADIPIAETGNQASPWYGATLLTIADEEMGTLVGQYTAQLVNHELGGQANVMILDYPDLPATVARANAMKGALLADAPNVKIVGNWTGGTSDLGKVAMTDALKKFPNINVIMSINDQGAFGAVSVLQAAGIDPKSVMIISVDADPNALNMIRNGEYFRGSVATSPATSGQLAVDAVIKMMSSPIVPLQIFFPAVMITKDNLDSLTPSPTAAFTPAS